MIIMNYMSNFLQHLFLQQKNQWVDKLNENSQPYIDDAHNNAEEKIQKLGTDFGHVYHSVNMQEDPKLAELVNWVGKTGFNLLDTWGVDMTNHDVAIHSMWVQEFAKDGGGHHRIHIHENCHISGFFFLENDNSSYPLFHDPRPGAAMTALPEKDIEKVSYYSKCVNYQPKPGSIYMFPSYLPHEYVMSRGGNFKFIHWNLMALPRDIVMAEGSV